MQSEESVGSNGHSEVIPSTTDSPYAGYYVVDHPFWSVPVKERNGEKKFILLHAFKRLDASRLPILIQREDNIIRENEEIGKKRERPKFSMEMADAEFYKAMIHGGGWKPYGSDEEFTPLSMDELLGITREAKGRAVERFLECKFVVSTTAEGEGISFLFEQDGMMRGELLIGDPDAPDYRIPMEIKRPKDHRRTEFRDAFTKVEIKRSGDKPRRGVKLDIRKGVSFFDEHFPDHSDAVSNVLIGGEPYTSDKRKEFLGLFNPAYKVEIAQAIVESFDRDDQD